jgi:hypothetical protein
MGQHDEGRKDVMVDMKPLGKKIQIERLYPVFGKEFGLLPNDY